MIFWNRSLASSSIIKFLINGFLIDCVSSFNPINIITNTYVWHCLLSDRRRYQTNLLLVNHTTRVRNDVLFDFRKIFSRRGNTEPRVWDINSESQYRANGNPSTKIRKLRRWLFNVYTHLLDSFALNRLTTFITWIINK